MNDKSCLLVAALIVVGTLTSAQQPSKEEGSRGVVSDQPAVAPEVPGRVRVVQGVTQGLLIKKVAPKYPKDARHNRVQGQVVMQATINKKGGIEDLQLISGHPALAAAAMKAVKQWKYRPYLLNGEPVEVNTQIVVNFTLSGD